MKHCTWTRHPHEEEFTASGHGPTTMAKLLSSYRALVLEMGGNADIMLEGAGIAPWLLDSPLAKIPVRALGQLLEDTAARLSCPDLGLRLAERQSTQAMMQPLDRLFCTAPSIRDALEGCVEHVDAFNSGLVMELDDRFASGLHLLDFRLLDGLSPYPQLIEQLLLLSHNSIIWLSAGFARSRMVCFSHLAVSPPVAYARRFNAVIKFGQEYDGLFFSDADLKARIAECKTGHFAYEVQLVAQRFPARRKGIDLMVRQMIFRVLAQSETCTRQNIAHLLGFRERTLNRHLSKTGTSFETIRDEVRRNLAFRYLARADLPLTEIAGRLGYSELAVLSRSCRRWFGTPPRQLRLDLLSSRYQAGQSGKGSTPEYPRHSVA